MFNFDFDDDGKRFLKEIKNQIKESPVYAKWGGGGFDDIHSFSGNFKATKNIKAIAKYITSIKKLKLYRITNGNIYDYFINEDFIAAAFRYKKQENVIFNETVFQFSYPDTIGLCRFLVFNYYLENECKQFVSSNVHTEKGENFWKKLLEEAMEKHYNVYVLENNKNKLSLNNTSDMKKYYSKYEKGLKYKFVIEK